MLQKLMKRIWKSEQAVNTKRAERQKKLVSQKNR